MEGTPGNMEEVLSDLLMLILPNIVGEPTREAFVELHIIINMNAASVTSKLGGGSHGHLTLTMATDDYLDQTGNYFVPLHNPGNYPLMKVTTQ